MIIPSIDDLEETILHSTPTGPPPLVDDVQELPSLVPDIVSSAAAIPLSPMSPISKISKHISKRPTLMGGPQTPILHTPGSPLALDPNSSLSITDSSNYDLELLQSPGGGPSDDNPSLLRYPSYVDEYYLRFSTEDEGVTDMYFDETPVAVTPASTEQFLASY